MGNAIVNMMLVIATVLISIVALSLYSFYISYTNSNLAYINAFESFSKSITISVSPLSFKAYTNRNPIIFNVSFLASVSVKHYDLNKGELIVVPFVTHSNPNIYLYVPTGLQNSSINVSSTIPVNGQVYLPDGNLLGTVNMEGYKVLNGQVFSVTSNVTSSEVIVLWVLVEFQGKFYRLGYTYLVPQDEGLGVYVASSSGRYNPSNIQVNLNPPLIFASNKGLVFGMWFEPYLISPSKSMLVNITFELKANQKVSLVFYTQGNGVYVNETVLQLNNLITSSVVETIYKGIVQGQWYFLNFSTGAQQLVGPNLEMYISLYDANHKQLSKVQLINPAIASANGYASIIQFGNSTSSVNLISQAVMSSEQNPNAPMYEVTGSLLTNGYLYNNSNDLYQIIGSSPKEIYSIVYWYFVSPYYPPPSQVSATVWYYPQGSKSVATTYIYETGNNMWVLS
ncbi:hypothetical protein [Stygiolobus caldivivus]|uniref:Uncharacterized protein n=1 Tax=Stygiolobus caldivivus TaxID=2824673 RepID=A0A8D5U5Z1_9CREN|nr:hypothetical protein [Stygiolobus caldivivus]BCU70195.1 hypothetical protein KN1_14920 [Stygiolobus caldivivus]